MSLTPALTRAVAPRRPILALLAAALLFPALASAQAMSEKLEFRAGADQITFVAAAGDVSVRDGVYSQVVTVRVTANDGKIRGALPNVAVQAASPELLAFGPALLFLDVVGLANAEVQGERFGLTLGNLPPGPTRVELASFEKAGEVRRIIGPYVLATVAADARTVDVIPPPNADRGLRALLIRAGALVTVPGNTAERPVVLSALPPPTKDSLPQLRIGVLAPAEAFQPQPTGDLPPGPTRFTAVLTAAADPIGTVIQGEVDQAPQIGDLPPSPIRRFITLVLPEGLPPGPTRVVVFLRFADGTIGMGAIVVPPQTND